MVEQIIPERRGGGSEYELCIIKNERIFNLTPPEHFIPSAVLASPLRASSPFNRPSVCIIFRRGESLNYFSRLFSRASSFFLSLSFSSLFFYATFSQFMKPAGEQIIITMWFLRFFHRILNYKQVSACVEFFVVWRSLMSWISASSSSSFFL